MGNLGITLLDTPGHVDFSAEMERTLQVLDYAILVINGADGVQGHTRTLWSLLKRYQIPTFIFINKMDQVGTDKAKVLADLQNRLDEGCIDFRKCRKKHMTALPCVMRKRWKVSGIGESGRKYDCGDDRKQKGVSVLFRFGAKD